MQLTKSIVSMPELEAWSKRNLEASKVANQSKGIVPSLNEELFWCLKARQARYFGVACASPYWSVYFPRRSYWRYLSTVVVAHWEKGAWNRWAYGNWFADGHWRLFVFCLYKQGRFPFQLAPWVQVEQAFYPRPSFSGDSGLHSETQQLC